MKRNLMNGKQPKAAPPIFQPHNLLQLIQSQARLSLASNEPNTTHLVHLPTETVFLSLKNPFTMSYADIAASGPKQTPEEAAAPQPPEVLSQDTASTSSLVDVDSPSVHTVPSDYREQDIQTDTQAQRVERDDSAKKAKAKAKAAADQAKATAEQTKRRAATQAKRADNWLTDYFARMSDGGSSALVLANLAGVVGLSSYLGYKAWALYDKGRLTWEAVGMGVGILAGVGAIEAVFGGYLQKGKKKQGSA